MKKIYLYVILILISIIMFLSVLIFNIDGKIGFLMVLLSIYLLFGAIIKLCKINQKFKNSILAFIDLLFWLP